MASSAGGAAAGAVAAVLGHAAGDDELQNLVDLADQAVELAACGSQLNDVVHHVQLFLDDYLIESMENTLKQIMGIGYEEYQEDEINIMRAMAMQVVSNENKVYGASCILYPKVLEEIAKKMGRNLYIIPSSVHEMLVLPDDGSNDGGYLQKLIAEVNVTQVEPEAVLSDQLYYYDSREKQIRIF